LELLFDPGRAGEGLLARSIRATWVLMAPMGRAPEVEATSEPNTIIAGACFTFPHFPELNSKTG
jgi:hypothetical protein